MNNRYRHEIITEKKNMEIQVHDSLQAGPSIPCVIDHGIQSKRGKVTSKWVTKRNTHTQLLLRTLASIPEHAVHQRQVSSLFFPFFLFLFFFFFFFYFFFYCFFFLYSWGGKSTEIGYDSGMHSSDDFLRGLLLYSGDNRIGIESADFNNNSFLFNFF